MPMVISLRKNLKDMVDSDLDFQHQQIQISPLGNPDLVSIKIKKYTAVHTSPNLQKSESARR